MGIYPVGYCSNMELTTFFSTWRVALSTWSARRWWSALIFGLGIAVIIALPTAVIPNPIFGRSIETTWWSYPTVIITGILGGFLMATYVREPAEAPKPEDDGEKDSALRWGTIGGFVSFFAVGCPVCNKTGPDCHWCIRGSHLVCAHSAVPRTRLDCVHGLGIE